MLKKSANSRYCGNFECSGYYYSGVQIYCKVEYLFHKFMYALDHKNSNRFQIGPFSK